MRQQVDLVRAEVAANQFNVIDILLNASLQLRNIRDVVRFSSIAQVDPDDTVVVGEILEIVEQDNSIEDQKRFLAGARSLKKEANAVVHRYVTVSHCHVF